MGKEDLRKLFGSMYDVNPELESMFGDAYMDFIDTTGDISQELSEFAASNVGPLIERAIEQSPEITCKFNQMQILRFINGYIQEKEFVPHDEWWAVMKHMNNCGESPCRELYEISCKDISLTPQEMKDIYGDKVKNWKIK